MRKTRFASPGRRLPAAVLGFLLLAGAGVAAESSSPAGRRSAAADSVDALRREGRLEAAVRVCREYNAAHPGDPVMLYNQACLENLAGRTDAAAASFGAAVDAGFAAFAYALVDPDLQGPVAADVAARIGAERERLAAAAARRAVTLRWDAWSEPLALVPNARDAASTEAWLRLRWRESGLDLELTAPAAWLPSDAGMPWHGGPGLVVTVAQPGAAWSHESADAFTFAFGVVKGGGVGALWVPASGDWQWVRELDPKLSEGEDGATVLRTLLPWQAVAPLHPLVDTPLGFNATFVRPGGGTLSLLEDPEPLVTVPQGRRVFPLAFDLTSADTDLFWGRVTSTVTGDQPIELSLTAVAAEAGDSELVFSFTDAAGEAIRGGRPERQPVRLARGVNTFTHRADFSQLPLGSYAVRVDLRFPGGDAGLWGASLLHLPPGWREDFAARTAALPAGERPTAEYHLAAVDAALAAHRPRHSPTPIATTLGDLAQMLDAAAVRGTILPESGLLLYVRRDAAGADHRMQLAVPPGRTAGVPTVPVLVTGLHRGDEARTAARIVRNYEYADAYRDRPARTTGGAWPVFVLPEGGDDGSGPTTLRAALAWARDYFAADRALLVGVDAAALASLDVAADPAAGVEGVLVFAGAGLVPAPGGDDARLAATLPPRPAAPIIWCDFVTETGERGQARRVLDLMRERGFPLEDVVEVRGGLNLTQVADRAVMWVDTGHPAPAAGAAGE